MDESVSPIDAQRRLPPLASLRAFEAAARHLSFRRAALELSVTPTAISHQVRGLEATLGQPLFRRLTRKLALTPAGDGLARALREGFDVIEAGLAALRAPRASVQLTLSASTAFTARWLLPRMSAFYAACPGIELRLQANDLVVDLPRGDADLAIRSGAGRWPGLHVQPLMREHYAPVCSPMLDLRTPDALAAQRLIHFDWQAQARDPATWQRWFREAGRPMPAPPQQQGCGPSFTDETHAILATLGGHGVAMLSLTLVAEELRSGALVQPFGPTLAAGGYYLATAAGRENEPAIRTVWAWISAQADAMPPVPRIAGGQEAATSPAPISPAPSRGRRAAAPPSRSSRPSGQESGA